MPDNVLFNFLGGCIAAEVIIVVALIVTFLLSGKDEDNKK